MEVQQPQGLTNTPASACTNACTENTESVHSDTPGTSDAAPDGEHFAEAVAMLARLPLTDAERAEAVRRLLAGCASADTAKPER